MLEKNDIYYMRMALKEARKAKDLGEVPVGCIILKDNKIISRAYNMKETKGDPTAHAEIIAIRKASKKLGWRLTDCHIFITLEPCPMCMGAIIESRVKRVVFGAYEPKCGDYSPKTKLVDFNQKVEVIGGVLEEECKKNIQDFFMSLRNKQI